MRGSSQIFQRTALLFIFGFCFLVVSRAGLDALWRTGVFAFVQPSIAILQSTGKSANYILDGWNIVFKGGSHLARLEAERADQDSLRSALEIIEKENALLRAELGRSSRSEREVLARFYGFRDHWFVDVGCKEGVQIGAPLFREGSLVGEVKEVYAQYASVRTLQDPSWRLPVQVGTASARGLFQVATGMPEVQEIPSAEPIQEGDLVRTLGGGLLPPGVLVGKVFRVVEESGTGTKHVQIALSYEPEEVMVADVLRSGEGNACP